MTLSVNTCGAQLLDEGHLMNSERHARAISRLKLRHSLGISLMRLSKTRIFSPDSRLCCQYWNRALEHKSEVRRREGKVCDSAQSTIWTFTRRKRWKQRQI